jgi:hypothetical protein
VNAPQVGRQPLPRVMNYSFGIQRDIGFNTVLDAAYVGSLGRNLLYVRNINAIPMYSRFDPANLDRTTNSPLPDNFFRPYLGMSTINVRGFGATLNYHSLQVTANRRMSRGLQFGASYTFSKALGVGAGDFDGVSPYFSMRQRNYGLLSYDATHVLTINYTWNLPNPAPHIKPVSLILGNWVVSGITSFQSGFPFTPGFSTTDAVDLTGSNEGARITVLGDPRLPKSERTFYRNFKTEMFARTPVRDFGNAGIGLLRAPASTTGISRSPSGCPWQASSATSSSGLSSTTPGITRSSRALTAAHASTRRVSRSTPTSALTMAPAIRAASSSRCGSCSEGGCGAPSEACKPAPGGVVSFVRERPGPA